MKLGLSDNSLKRLSKVVKADRSGTSEVDPSSVDSSTIETIMSWHDGQGSVLYAVGSNFYAGKPVSVELVESAISELERCINWTKDEDVEALYDAIDDLKESIRA